jgi:coproporphyrinogen III oxidase
MIESNEIAEWFKGLQNRICHDLESLDGQGKFHEELWDRPGGGGGRTRILQNGKLIEKGGVNFSAVFGLAPQAIQDAFELPNSDFFATGVSIVLHPHNPWVPVIHMNVRYFEIQPQDQDLPGSYWFGGGIDLTPHFIDPKEGGRFHRRLKETCDRFSLEYYPRFKTWADDYFFLKHRKETRGVGGIFFDRLSETPEISKEALWEFVQAMGETFMPVYTEVVTNRRDNPFGDKERAWQMLRRGRYVEFNLVWDKGTRFGLDTDGRTESILMSMPPVAHWAYDYQPAPGSLEEATLQWLKKDIDWIAQ